MKNKNSFLKSLAIVLACGVISLSLFRAHAQVATNAPVATTNAPASFYGGLQETGQAILNAGQTWLATNSAALSAAKRWTAVPYGTYAPSAPSHIGGGLFVAYNVSEYIGAGIGLDYLGRLTMPSGQVTLKLPLTPLKFIGLDWIVTPFAFAGISTPITAKSDGIGSITGAGASMKFASFTVFGKQADIGLAGAVTKWTGCGDYSGTHYQFMPVLHVIF